VAGNEAADADSIVCALAYAALLRAEGDAGALALVAVPRDDLALRAEVAWLLQREGVDAGALLFADDVDVAKLHADGRLTRTVLVGA
jgi:inorganic pyrophosphatase/exopolyphosphatase